MQGFGEPRSLSPLPTLTPPPSPPQGSRQVSTLTLPPTGADNPDYENITLTFRNQDQRKGSHSPPKSQGKQSSAGAHRTALGGDHGRASWEQGAPCGGWGQWCGARSHQGLCYSRRRGQGVSFAGGDDDVGGVGVGGSVGEGLGDGDGGEVTT